MSDRIAVVNGGRILQLDTPRAIYERPAHRFVAEFIGESTFVPVAVAGGQVRLAGRALRTAEHPGSSDGERLLMLRPERLRLLSSAEASEAAGSGGLNVLRGRLAAQVYQGDSALLQVALEDGTVVCLRHATHGNGEDGREPGCSVMLGLSPQDAVLLPAEHGAP